MSVQAHRLAFVFVILLATVGTCLGILFAGGFVNEEFEPLRFLLSTVAGALVLTTLVDGAMQLMGKKSEETIIGTVAVISTLVGLCMFLMVLITEGLVFKGSLFMFLTTGGVAFFMLVILAMQDKLPELLETHH